MFLNHNDGIITVSHNNDFRSGETYSIDTNNEYFLHSIVKEEDGFYLSKTLPFDTENLEAELLTLKNKEEKTEADLNRIQEIYQEMMNWPKEKSLIETALLS